MQNFNSNKKSFCLICSATIKAHFSLLVSAAVVTSVIIKKSFVKFI